MIVTPINAAPINFIAVSLLMKLLGQGESVTLIKLTVANIDDKNPAW